MPQITYYSLREGAGGLLAFNFESTDIVPCTNSTALTTCLDPSKPVLCGSGCIGYGQCCKSDPTQGEKCPSTTECPADGGVCSELG